MKPEKKELIETALDALERLLKLFQVERYLYLVISVLSFFLLVYVIFVIISTKGADTKLLAAIGGSSGLIAMTTGRISFFFNKAFSLIETLIKDLTK